MERSLTSMCRISKEKLVRYHKNINKPNRNSGIKFYSQSQKDQKQRYRISSQ